MTSSRGDDSVDCCIAGCGPAGAILGLLLARAGVRVRVLEKHADFLRDFRGDTIHPSTLEILDDIGLADRFLHLPHTEVDVLEAVLPTGEKVGIDFRHIGSRYPFIAFVPQWDFLDFIADEAAHYPTFTLERNAEVVDLLKDDRGDVRGVQYRTPDAERQVHARLTIGADGRGSRTRAAAALPLVETSPPMDVLWFRISRRGSDGSAAALQLAPGHFVGTFPRGDFWQVAYVIPKGADAQVRAAGLAAFQRSVAQLLPDFADRVAELDDWDRVKLLSVRSDRLGRWYRPGYLAIGDAAHAMSPIGGVGINMAIQDAVVAANLLWRPLRQGYVSTYTLKRVQRRRELPVRLIQAVQTFIQDRLLEPTMTSQSQLQLPPAARLLMRLPILRLLPARLMANGIVRPHVRSPAAEQVGDPVPSRFGDGYFG